MAAPWHALPASSGLLSSLLQVLVPSRELAAKHYVSKGGVLDMFAVLQTLQGGFGIQSSSCLCCWGSITWQVRPT